MHVVIDAVVREFVETIIIGLCEEDEKIRNLTGEAGQAAVFMNLLESIVIAGLATHTYVRSKNLDEFRATDNLIERWMSLSKKVSMPVPDRSEMHHTSIKGHRSKYFNDKWGQGNPNDPLPSWLN